MCGDSIGTATRAEKVDFLGDLDEDEMQREVDRAVAAVKKFFDANHDIDGNMPDPDSGEASFEGSRHKRRQSKSKSSPRPKRMRTDTSEALAADTSDTLADSTQE